MPEFRSLQLFQHYVISLRIFGFEPSLCSTTILLEDSAADEITMCSPCGDHWGALFGAFELGDAPDVATISVHDMRICALSLFRSGVQYLFAYHCPALIGNRCGGRPQII